MMEFLQPPGWPRARGYSNGVAASGRTVFVSGMIGWDAHGVFHTDDFAGQVRQALENIVAVLAEAGAGPQHIARMTWYVLDTKEYVAAYKAVGAAYRDIIGAHYPAMTAVQVAGLVEERARVEIEVTAVVPDLPARA
jgi:enamine deaminase RidA (YjgF/YER057c/UK114 family)